MISALRWTTVAALAASPLIAQGPEVDVEGIAGAVSAQNDVPGYGEHLTGSAGGFEGTVRFGRVIVDLAYLDGALSPGAAGLADQDVVDARVDVGVRMFGWLTLDGGPHERAYGTGAATERWTQWELRSRADVPLIPGLVSGHLGLWRTVAVSGNAGEAVDYAQGGTAGVMLGPASAAYRVGLDYELDDTELGGGNDRAVLEAVVLHVGVAVP